MITPENLERARAEAVFAYDNVAFFRRLYDDAGVRPEHVHAADAWSRLPTTQKADYRRTPSSEMLARGRGEDDAWLVRSRSSGSDGEPVISVCARVLLTRRWLETLAIHPAFGFPLTLRGYKTARLAAPNSTEPGRPGADAPMAERIFPDRTLLLPADNDLLATPAALLDQSAQELCDYAPDLLYADANQLWLLTRHMARRRISPPAVRAIACTNAMLTATVRRRLAAAFPPATPLSEVVSMSELGWLGMECPRGVLHLNAKSFFLELLVEDRWASPGEAGELCVTSIGDQVLPRVRYLTGDVYRLLEEPCPCGHGFPAVTMQGRATRMIHAPGGPPVTPRQIDDAVGAPDGLALYQLVQTGAHEVVLRYLADGELPQGERERLTEALGSVLRTSTVSVERVDYLPTERSGKLSTVRPLHQP